MTNAPLSIIRTSARDCAPPPAPPASRDEWLYWPEDEDVIDGIPDPEDDEFPVSNEDGVWAYGGDRR